MRKIRAFHPDDESLPKHPCIKCGKEIPLNRNVCNKCIKEAVREHPPERREEK